MASVTMGVADLNDLRKRVLSGETEYAILLAGGLAYSRKTIRLGSKAGVGRVWVVVNHIDDTRQKLTDAELWTDSHIGEALDKGALVVVA